MGKVTVPASLGNNSRPWWHISKKIQRNPFDPVPVIEHLEHCQYCEIDVDVTVEVGQQDGIDLYRKRCNRCGRVVLNGIGMRHLTTDSIIHLPASVVRFIQERGKDRR